MTAQKVVVEKDDGSLVLYRRQLRQFGLKEESQSRFTGTAVTKRRISNIKRFCRKIHARFYYDDANWTRSTNYRSTFFAYNPPMAGNTYICVYCGRRIRKEHITIDHIYPVAKIASSRRLQKKLNRKGIRGANAPENLVPACSQCNLRKGTKTGLWVLRAKIGKNESLWRARKLLRLMAAIFTLFIMAGFLLGWFNADIVFERLGNILIRFIL